MTTGRLSSIFRAFDIRKCVKLDVRYPFSHILATLIVFGLGRCFVIAVFICDILLWFAAMVLGFGLWMRSADIGTDIFN